MALSHFSTEAKNTVNNMPIALYEVMPRHCFLPMRAVDSLSVIGLKTVN